jgi:hypothetical protein
MTHDINTQKIRELLNISSSQLSPQTLEKLRIARTHALEHQRVSHSLPVLAWLGHHGSQKDSFHFSKSVNWAVAVIFAACLISGASYWHSYTTEHEISEIDMAILTDDMPLHVYVD